MCLNPRLREERAGKREDLLRTTQLLLEDIAAAIRHARPRGRDTINRRVGTARRPAPPGTRPSNPHGSPCAPRKKRTPGVLPNGYPVHSFRTLLNDLATLTLNEVTLPGRPEASFPMLARPTPLQQRAFSLLDIEPHKSVASNLTA